MSIKINPFLWLVIVFLCIGQNQLSAQDNPINALEIVHHQGDNTYVRLSNELRINFNVAESIVEFRDATPTPTTIAFADVSQCNHVYHSFSQSGIYELNATAEIWFDGSMLILNFPYAELYSVSGICLRKYISDGGRTSINLDDFDSNQVLILNYGENKSIKIRK